MIIIKLILNMIKSRSIIQLRLNRINLHINNMLRKTLKTSSHVKVCTVWFQQTTSTKSYLTLTAMTQLTSIWIIMGISSSRTPQDKDIKVISIWCRFNSKRWGIQTTSWIWQWHRWSVTPILNHQDATRTSTASTYPWHPMATKLLLLLGCKSSPWPLESQS